MEVPRPQIVLLPTTLYHTNGFATMHNLLAGDRLVVLERFDAALVVDLVERHRVTTFTATPTMLQRIADLPGIDDRDLSSLVWVLQGAAVIPPSLVHRWIELIGAERFFMAYGMTEGLGLAALRADEWLEHPGSVGRGFRDTELRDPRARRRRPPDGRGRRDLPPLTDERPLRLHRRRRSPADHRRRLRQRGRHGVARRRWLPLHRRPARRHDRHRWRQRVPGRGGERAHRAPRDRRRGGDRAARPRVGAAGARHRRARPTRTTLRTRTT